MKLRRLAQSTLMVSNSAGGTLLLDPGQYNLDPGRLTLETCPAVDVIIVTHKHADHFHLPMLQAMLAQGLSTAITNAEIAGCLPGTASPLQSSSLVTPLPLQASTLQSIRADHVVRGEVIDNFGVVVLSNGASFYYTSDTRFMDAAQLPDTVKGTTVFVPVSNRGVVMGIDDAAVGPDPPAW